MVVLNLLNDVSIWAFRLIQQYKTKEELLLANNRLLQVLLELERARSAEEIKALKLENDLNVQRERLGRDLHDCIGSQLTHVISRLDLLTNSNESNHQQLLRLNEYVREMNRTLRETIWVLDQESVTARTFGNRVQGMLFKIWEGLDSPTLKLRIETDSEQLLIQPFQALQIIRIIQEGTNNALKYAQATEVTLRMIFQKNKLLITIEDNGCGFDAASVGQGYGISNIRRRTEAINGGFKLKTSSTGTCLKVKIPNIL